ncbi:526_t:CDS:10 [Diversispora eburnea]|uniref:526_t:CDS:1 n=1 Tax=Diversispora eburnea TaxID=1213867 RepID=A0A9N8YJI9_9GLOM|nr:526_t:CDS:10 [Diversispora eburnea]
MVKSYLRFEPWKTFGVISSSLSNAVLTGEDTLTVAPALEDIILWDLKKGLQKEKWHDSDNKSEVTVIARSPNNQDYAVGYTDGSIRIWRIGQSATSLIFNGHRKAVTSLLFDKTGTRLASGSKDTNIILWDVIGEVGLFRLCGHKDQITSIRFLPKSLLSKDNEISSPGYLISSSKDTLLKLWDLSTQHCIETVVSHRSEIWDFDISKDGKMIVTGGDDADMKVWTIDYEVLESNFEVKNNQNENNVNNAEVKKVINFYGNVKRQGKDRVVTLKFHPKVDLLGVQGPEKFVEIFRIHTHEEIKKKMARRKKRQKEKNQKLGINDVDENMTIQIDNEVKEKEINVNDMITPYQIIRANGKIRSFDFLPNENISKINSIQILTSLTNNTLELYALSLPSKKKDEPVPTNLYSLDIPGHRNDVRTLALSSDDELLCSCSKDNLKIWNVKSSSCIKTIECGYALCCSFLPGDRYVIVGTKSGHLELFDLASSSIIESIEAHDGPIWSLHIRPDKEGIVTGSADKNVKFWDFEFLLENSNGEITTSTRRLTLIHKRTLKMTDDVLCVRYSPNQKLIAVGLLDSTVKVFYSDTLKFFLSLYGHKLPVLSMDISSDNSLLVTGSADKNIKIWGLDFGDCRKSIFAHQDSIMCVQFLHHTHYIFSSSKDRLVKYWDGDKFENIMKLEGHHGEIWSLVLSKRGDLLVTCSHDRSIRMWEQTDEPLFLEEEREKEMEELYESTLTTTLEKTNLDDLDTTLTGKQTIETLKAGERIIEALDIADEYTSDWTTYNQIKERGQDPGPPPKSNPILVAFGNLTGDQYVLKIIEKIRSSDLEEALLILPFTKVISLLRYLDIWAKKEWNVVLTSRILIQLLKVHHDQIVANRVLRPILDSLRTHIHTSLKVQKSNKSSEFFEDLPTDNEIESESLKKRKFINLKT